MISTREVQSALIGYLRMDWRFVLANVYVLDSPWESDVISVTSKLYWTEYEIKVSVADYRADFRKRWGSTRKHEYYASDRVSHRKPKKFYFVVPKGMLDNVEVPDHCGILEFDPENRGSWGIRETRVAPHIVGSKALDTRTLYNLATKASLKVTYTGVGVEVVRSDEEESCSRCREQTRFWNLENDVALCIRCATVMRQSDVLSKEEWLSSGFW